MEVSLLTIKFSFRWLNQFAIFEKLNEVIEINGYFSSVGLAIKISISLSNVLEYAETPKQNLGLRFVLENCK